MKNAIIVHGTCSKEEYYDKSIPSLSNANWIPWLSNELLMNDIPAYAVEVPQCYAPDYVVWCREFERFEITNKTILIGHSCGGGFLVRWLSEHPEVSVNRVVLVAPWLDPENEKNNNFFDFVIDPNISRRTESLTIFHSLDDMKSVVASVKTLREQISDINYKEFTDKGHFCYEDLNTDAFPRLLKFILS